MSIFGDILGKIFHHGGAQAAPGGTTPGATPGTTTADAGTSGGSSGSAAPAAPGTQVDVEAILNDLASKAGQPLNWRTSIVDLMKLLNLDSGLAARKSLAGELHYTGDTNDSASMNIWLHKQVMQKLAANGGKVPEELKH